MSEDIYKRLRERITQNSFFFPAKVTGEDIELLKQIFTEDEAEMYLNLTMDLETPQQIAGRAMQDTEKVTNILKRMASKGQVFPKRKGDTYYYAATPFAHGILEHQLFRTEKEFKEFAGNFSKYIFAETVQEEQGSDQQNEFKMPEMPMRTIPVKVPVNISSSVAPYEDVKEIIKSQDRIAVTNCFCVKLNEEMLGADVDQPREVCMMLGFYADYYVENGWARKISREEALEILDLAEEAGLVHQIPNTEDPGAICNCGPNSCLKVLQMMPDSAKFAITNYFAQVDQDLCSGCEICVERCPVDACSITSEEVASINLDRCIGCGLCINTCSTEALTLVSKQEEERRDPGPTCEFMRSSKDIESSIS